jgi:putative transposase
MAGEADAPAVGLSGLTEGQREQAMTRWRLLAPHVEGGVPLARIAEHSGVGERTLQRWAARYRSAGLAGLARAGRADRGQRRIPADLRLLIEGLALRRQPPSVATIHRQVAGVANDLGWPVPAYATVHAVVRGIDPGLAVLAHEGTKRYKELFDLVYRREADRPNAIWQADHTQLDLWIVTPSGHLARPWLTIVEDDYSRAAAGYAVNLGAPSALNTALAFRQAIWRKDHPDWHVCGIPDVFYVDHGSDFTSAHLEQVMADLRIQARFSLPGQPPVAGGRWSGSSAPSTRCACLACPATPPAAPGTGPGRPGSAWPSWTRRSGCSSARSITSPRTARPASEYRPLSAGELAFVLQRHWAALGLTLSADDFTDAEAIAAVHRITNGNFRLVQRLFTQITRVLEINGLSVISREVVETARESLVIGTL